MVAYDLAEEFESLLKPMQADEIDNVVPFPASAGGPEGPMGNTPKCPLCRRPLVDRGDPGEATSVRDFLRRSHAADPLHYHAVLKANPVNANVARDEKSRELLTDFGAETIDLDEDGQPMRANIRRQVDAKLHHDWLNQQFK